METPLRILHIEDNEADAGLVKRALKAGGFNFVVRLVDTRADFELALTEFDPDVILSDHSLPQFDSMDALAIYKQYNLTAPFILITGSVSEEFAVKSIKEGADDYILKSSLIRLPNAIQHALKTKKAEQEKAKASQLLLASNKELNTFIYKAAHDLRGPLCSIMGLTNVAAMESEKENLAEYIRKISESTKKLDAVLLSLIEAMSIRDARPQVREVNFQSLITGVIEKHENMEGFGAVRFMLNITTNKGFYSDAKILSTILDNLIENAIMYRRMGTNDAYISIKAYHTETGVNIEVEDNGIGIDTAVQDQVFDMYFRGNQNSTGSGLGLYIVKNGVEKLGGTIELSSTLKTGSKFTIHLPGHLVLM